MRGQEGGLHGNTEGEKVKPKPRLPRVNRVTSQAPPCWGAGSHCWVYPRAVHLQSGMPVCQAGGWEREGARNGKRAVCLPWGRLRAAVSIPDPPPCLCHLRPHTGPQHRPAQGPRGWRVPPPCHCFRKRETAWLEGPVFMSFYRDFPFSFYLSCKALHSLLLALSLLTQPLECGKGIYNLSSLLVIQHLNKFEMWVLYPTKDMFKKNNKMLCRKINTKAVSLKDSCSLWWSILHKTFSSGSFG